jgi:class 3 adenylate cyclase/WD40 repeat protein
MSGRGPDSRTPAVRTFLVADIRGYTRFTAQHGDEAAARLTGRFAEVAAEAIEAWAGRLVEIRGDEALAVFDSARQALRCAVELQDALADETATDPALPLTVGIGLDAGEAVSVGDGYRGAALNLAARLCGAAAAGEVIASQELAHLAGRVDGLVFEELPAAELKGFDTPVSAVRVTDGNDGRATAGPFAGPTAERSPGAHPPELEAIVPLVGRAAELSWLRWHWRRARHGHSRAVVISGPPGIGKTRLAAELASMARDTGASIAYMPSGRGLEDGVPPTADGPRLLIVDDLDAAPASLGEAVATLATRPARPPELLLVTHREEAAAPIHALAERLAPPEARRRLEPLETDGIRSIAALYVGRSIDQAALARISEESGGVPAVVHRVAGQWARGEAISRLGSSADRTATGRRDLRAAETDLIGDVAELELVEERTRLYGIDGPDDRVRSPGLTVCPYKGLASFDASDADYYFGRERLIAELVARLVGSPFLGLVGPSGSGKSSALRAGLLPALAGGVLPGSDRWIQVVVRPGEHPLVELAQALARTGKAGDKTAGAAAALDRALASLASGQQLLLVVDQFEEVFGATRDESERSAFIGLLATERTGLKVVVSLRADHYGHCAAYPAFARALAGSNVLVGPLTTEELRSVITAPAGRAGLRIEPGLAEALVDDAGTEPGVLPLLSTALLELWQARDGDRLTLAAYRASGGLHGAVGRLAESAYSELDPAEQTIARSIFLRLSGPGEGEGVVRRRVALDELDAESDATAGRVLEKLTAARLLTTGDGYAEVAHEALLREWPRLQGWLEDDATGRKLRLHLIGAARDWDQRGREPSELYRGARLAAALDWAADHGSELNAAEREFIEASRVASQRDVERERRTNRRLRGLLAGAAGLLVVAVGAGAVALYQANAANDQARLAAERAEAASAAEQVALDAEAFGRSRELAANAVSTLEEDPALAKLLAVAAVREAEPDPEVESALRRAWAADHVIGRYSWPTTDPEFRDLWTELHPDGDIFVALGPADHSSRFEVVDRASGDVLWEFTSEQDTYLGRPMFTPDGRYIVASSLWGPDPEEPRPYPGADAVGLRVWEARTGRLVERFDVGRCGGWSQSISIDSVLLATFPESGEPPEDCYASGDGSAMALVSLDDGARRDLTPDGFGDGVLSADGRYASFSDRRSELSVVMDLTTGTIVSSVDPFTAGNQNAYVRALSPDGSLLAYGARPIQVRDAASGEIISAFGAEAGEFGEGRFSATGDAIFTTARDSALLVSDPRTGERLLRVPAAGSGAVSVAKDGLVMVADPTTGTALIVDPGDRGEIGAIRTCDGDVPATTLEVVGHTAIVANDCEGGLASVLDLPGRRLVTTHPGQTAQALILSPDGRRIARQEADADGLTSPIRVRHVTTGALLVEMQGLCPWNAQQEKHEAPDCRAFPSTPFALENNDLEWSPDGRWIASIDDPEGFLAVWDAQSGALVHTESPPEDDAFSSGLRFSPDSDRLYVGTLAGRILVLSVDPWTVVDEASLASSPGITTPLGVAGFVGDGSTLVVVGGFLGRSGGWLHRVDADTLEVLGSNEAHEGSPKSVAISPDRSLVATGASDGIVRVWDAQTGELRNQLVVKGQAQGLAFVDDSHIAIAPVTGGVLLETLDRDELIRIVASSLSRGFSEAECARFGFGDDCPTLEELRSGS